MRVADQIGGNSTLLADADESSLFRLLRFTIPPTPLNYFHFFC